MPWKTPIYFAKPALSKTARCERYCFATATEELACGGCEKKRESNSEVKLYLDNT